MKKRILVINPLATSEWNESDRVSLMEVAAKDTNIEVLNIEKGPPAIESYYDIAFATPDILRIIKETHQDYDGIMINCFGDPGLMPARELVEIPVVGPGESALLIASLLGHKFSVITPLRNRVPSIEIKVGSMGLIQRLSSVEHIDVRIEEMLKSDRVAEALIDILRKIEKKTEVAVLGCCGFLPVYRKVIKCVKMPIVEPATAALKVLESLIDLRLTHSKSGLYSYPAREKMKI